MSQPDARKRIASDYNKAVVRGLFFQPFMQYAATTELPVFGLAGTPIERLGLTPPTLEKKLLESHILSVDTLCGLSLSELTQITNSNYAAKAEKCLVELGLSLGMDSNTREGFSQAPSAVFLERIPEFATKFSTLAPGKRPTVRAPSGATSSRLSPEKSPIPEYFDKIWIPDQEKKPHDFISPFKFPISAFAERFIARASFMYTRILQEDAEARRLGSSSYAELAKPFVRLPTYKKDNGRESSVYPVSMSETTLQILAEFTPQHPELVQELRALEAEKTPAATPKKASTASPPKSVMVFGMEIRGPIGKPMEEGLPKEGATHVGDPKPSILSYQPAAETDWLSRVLAASPSPASVKPSRRS